MPAQSNTFSNVSYNAEKLELRLTFLRSGKTYLYRNVEPQVGQAMLASESRGAFFNSFIKNFYEYEEA